MKTIFEKQICIILGCAVADTRVGPRAREMLTDYAINYKHWHFVIGNVCIEEAVARFCGPVLDLKDAMSRWDGKYPETFKGPFCSLAEAIKRRVGEQDFENLNTDVVEMYWNELFEVIIQYLVASEEASA